MVQATIWYDNLLHLAMELNDSMNLWTINAGHDLSAHINDRHTLLSRAAGHITRREPIAAYIHLLR